MGYYKDWLYSAEGNINDLLRDDTIIFNEWRRTNTRKGTQEDARWERKNSNHQILVRQDGSCDVLWPRDRKDDGKWKHYADLDTVKVAALLKES